MPCNRAAHCELIRGFPSHVSDILRGHQIFRIVRCICETANMRKGQSINNFLISDRRLPGRAADTAPSADNSFSCVVRFRSGARQSRKGKRKFLHERAIATSFLRLTRFRSKSLFLVTLCTCPILQCIASNQDCRAVKPEWSASESRLGRHAHHTDDPRPIA